MANALVSINGVDLPTPAKYLGITADIVDAARNTEGVTIGAVVREDVAKVECTWGILTISEWATICKLFNSNYGGAFYQPVTFFNQVTGTWITRTMYPNDRTTGGALPILDSNGAPKEWKDAALNLIEK